MSTSRFESQFFSRTFRLKTRISELSLPTNTLLVLDETKIEAGGLTQIGTGNIGAISDLVDRRTIKFDYQFYQKDFETDITCISLTFGKSLLSYGEL